jgi:hypothetical protein
MTKQTPDPVLSPEALSMIERRPSTFDAYLEFMCADEATQSELWNKSMKAFQKYPPQNLRLSEKEGSVQNMMNEQDPQTPTSEGMEGNAAYEVGSYAVELVASGRDPLHDATVGGAFATLALAFEQRTANLIAYLEHTEGSAYVAASATIKARLGL